LPDNLQVERGALIFASLAEVYLDSGMIDEAVNILKDGLARNPTYTFGHFLLGKAYFLKNDYAAAQQKFEEAIGHDPKMVSAHVYLGHIFRKLEAYPRAVEYYTKALELAPNDNEIRHQLVEVEAALAATRPAAPAKAEPAAVEPKPEPPVPTPSQPAAAETPPVAAIPRLEELRAALEETLPQLDLTAALPPEVGPEPASVEPVPGTPVVEDTARPSIEIPPEPPTAAVPTAVEEIPIKAKLDEIMSKLVNLESVTGAIVTTKDGLLIGNYLKGRQDAEENAAMVAAIYKEASSCFDFLDQGVFERGVVERKGETIYIFVSQEAILCVMTVPTTKPGLIFTFCGKVLEQLKGILE
jgi:predicted regulator of Ras-like GTPase activity (Roadblock/LC7/MglB family)